MRESQNKVDFFAKIAYNTGELRKFDLSASLL